ncbi:hypothetical protein [Haloarchaeobius sp. HRN-SO-5]|uniref:hypothetical protein n=1 Tax=Haloarchaeobius sp. HRN-SO-5 TaxID=3446118 RepID=UPI003EB6ABB0
MASITPLLGLLVAPLFAGLVYIDATRRGLPQPVRLLCAGSVGIASFVGFLQPAPIRNFVEKVYWLGIKSNGVAYSPYEMLVLHISAGVIISLLAALLYILGSRNVSVDGRFDFGTH